jgi:hypothetical protein
MRFGAAYIGSIGLVLERVRLSTRQIECPAKVDRGTYEVRVAAVALAFWVVSHEVV